MKELIVISGPTASGKTDLAIEVARKLDQMSIGTARPLPEEQRGIAHHLIGFLPPDAEYSAACYQRDAMAAIDTIALRGKQPILAGGTGLYLNSILYEMDFSTVEPDKALRARLSEEYENNPAQLHARLAQLDPSSALRIHQNDKKRLIRRLEILESGGEQAYEFRRPQQKYRIDHIGICKERKTLYRDIEKRVDLMFERGLEAEARRIYQKYGPEIPAFSAIGYKEFLPYFNNEITLEQAKQLIKQNPRRFAKRQLTWFRRESEIQWFYLEQYESKEKMAQAVVTCLKKRLGREE